MRFLIDNAVSHIIALGLHYAGHDALHVRDIGLATASDEIIFDRALEENRTIISADTDFGTLLALRQQPKPSVILFRYDAPRIPSLQLELLLKNVAALSSELENGCVVVFNGTRVRVRSLPILKSQ